MLRYGSILIILLISLRLTAQEEGSVDKLLLQIEKFGQVKIEFSNPGLEALSEIATHISVYLVDDKVARATLSGNDINYMRSFSEKYSILSSGGVKAVQSALSVSEAMNWDLYPTYQQYDSIMHKLASDYPDLCRVDTIGESIEGRLILALKISDNVALDEEEPQVFYSSTMHGDELLGYVLMLHLSEHLLANATNGGLEQQLVDSLEIWINPLSNPDGTYNGGDTISSPIRFNSNGKDLNRNFPDPAYPDVVQEKENVEMISFMREHNFVMSANLHSGVELVNYPWDKYSNVYHADNDWFRIISRNYADTVQFYSVPGYFTDRDNGITHGGEWLVIHGGRQDFITYENQGREVTLELVDSYQTPASQLLDYWEYHYRSLMQYLSNAFYGIHGKVIDDVTGDPVEAKILIQHHDKDSSHIYSDTISGSFYRLIESGSWMVAVLAEGYEPAYFDNFEVLDLQQRYLAVRLTKDISTILETEENNLKIWPVPTRDNLNIKLPPGFGNRITLTVLNIDGKEMVREIKDSDSELIINIHVSNLAPGIYFMTLRDIITQKKLTGRFIVY